MKNPYHYFASNAVAWRVHADLYIAIDRLRKATKSMCNGCAVYRVEGELNREYEINHYRPVVPMDELEMIDNIWFTETAFNADQKGEIAR